MFLSTVDNMVANFDTQSEVQTFMMEETSVMAEGMCEHGNILILSARLKHTCNQTMTHRVLKQIILTLPQIK